MTLLKKAVLIYYILRVVNLVHVLVTFCDGVLQRIYYKDMSL